MPRGLRILLAVAILFPTLSSFVQAEAVPAIFLTEVQTSSSTSGSQEFIELYNNTDADIDLADTVNDGQDTWTIQYFSSTKVMQADFSWDSTAASGEIALTGIIPAHDYYLLSSSLNGTPYQPDNVVPDQTYSSPHLSETAGGLQLVEMNDSAVIRRDHVGWSSSDAPPRGLMATPPAGGSLQRQVDDQGNYVDTEGALGPFVPATTASPKEAWQTPPPDSDTGQPGDDTGQIDDTDNSLQINDTAGATLRLTELLPNPAKPADDAHDEFVELYNDGDEPADLGGFTIQTGLTYAYSYTIPDGTLAPHAYTTFTSGDTPLALANSGGQARLLNASGQLVDETTAYGTAPEGQAWALFDDSWQWTTTPTPGAVNNLNAPAGKTAKPAAAPKAKKTASKTTAKAKKAGAVAGSQTNGGDPLTEDQTPTLHPAVLAGVGAAALLYGAYEYRTDLANRLYQLRHYRATRRAARAAAKGA